MIKPGRPPNFDKILAKFPMAAGFGVIFAYGEDIYTTGSLWIPEYLLAHEQVHMSRQIPTGIESWWDMYLSDSSFRYDEELLAHAAEYKFQAKYGGRSFLRSLLKTTASRLAAPLYGYDITLKKATIDLRKELAI